MALIIPSANAGLKTYEILRGTSGYRSREALLKELYRKYGNHASQHDIYEELQGIDRDVSTNLREEDMVSLKDQAETMPGKWKSCFTDTGRDHWWKFSVECADPAVSWLSDLALIKVYISVDDIAQIPDMFCKIVSLLLEQSDNRFHAKVSRCKRKDSMCFWVSRLSYGLLEDCYKSRTDVISGALPFVSYRGNLGISRELATFDSHNSVQAMLISRYFSTVEEAADIDLGDMYSLLVKAWNKDLPDKHPMMESFKYERAQTILLLLDTMDICLCVIKKQ